jgi:pimeloyl-ACP methyl ester carboxylesterase
MSSAPARRLHGMDHVKSQDGTPIAYQRTGEGPVLVLVVGAFCDRTSTADLTPLLAPEFTVVEYDRRGRGDSGPGEGPGDDIDPAREIEDLAAVIEATGGSAAVYGHSSGGALALEAAAAGLPVTRLAVYEPPYDADPDGTAPALREAVHERLAAGDPDGAATRFLEATGMPPQALAGVRSSSWWPRMAALAPALVHDLALIGSARVPAERFAAIGCPTLVLSGGPDASSSSPSGTAVADAVPGARYEVVAGQTHAVEAAAVAPVLLDWFGR